MPAVRSLLTSLPPLPRSGFNFGILAPTLSSNFTATQGTVSALRSVTFVSPSDRYGSFLYRHGVLLAAESRLKRLQ